MKQRIIIVLIACASMMVSTPNVVRAQVSISASIQINSPSDFYQPLEPYGTWVDVHSYGRCWRPRGIAVGWQPYTQGHWEWTDAGWYWVSDEPWGWACFHYGSWYQDASYGWVWIPATDWAPAWVTWRYSDAYIGWAPCGPGLSILAPSFFTFCDVHRFRDHFHSRGDLIVNNTTIINRTKVVKKFQRQSVDFDGHQRTIFANRGPGVDPIRRATGKEFTPRPVREVIRETPRPDNVRHDNNQQRDQRRETPAPTGRDQQSNYQQPDNRRRDQSPPIYQTQQQQQRAQSEQRNPQTEQRKEIPAPQQYPTEQTLPPTGRDDVRTPQPEHREAVPPVRQPQEVPKPAPEQHKEVPVAPPHPAAPAERTLPPTGREDIHPQHPNHPAPPAQAPIVRPVPPTAPPARVPGDGHARDGRDKSNP